MRRPGRTRKRKGDTITYSKVLNPSEQRLLWAYLCGDLRSKITGKFIKTCSVNTKRTILMCELLCCTGIRSTELVQLRLQDMPYALGVEAIEVYRGKGDKDRSVAVSERLATEIKNYIENVRPKTLPRYIKRNDTTRPLFYSQNKRPYIQIVKVKNKLTGEVKTTVRASSSIYKKIRKLGEHAGIIKWIHPHMLRHTFATDSLRKGATNIFTLQQLLGHSDMKITAKYLHIATAGVAGLGGKLDRQFEAI